MRVVMRAGTAVTVAALVALVPSAAFADGGRGSDGGADRGAPVLSDPLASGLAGPLQIAVGRRGDVFVAQGFASTLTVLGRGGRADYAVNGIDGIDEANGTVYYTVRGEAPQEGQQPTFSTLLKWGRDGNVTTVADLLYHETMTNPDAVNEYGFESIAPDCAAQLPPELGPAQYTGQVDTNPFGVLATDGRVYIADAGGNDVLAVGRNGKVRTLAVLPPQPTVVTADAATALGLPVCAVGLTYRFEPVPTDIELGRDGMLYVTTLPGGPESPVLGARGSVYRIDPSSGETTRVATGFLGATNLAIGPNGTIYVSELFANRISKVGADGTPVPVVDVPSPSGLEYANGKLYVSYDVFQNGSVATVSLRDAHGRDDDGRHDSSTEDDSDR